MTQEELREFEHKMHEETNEKVLAGAEAAAGATAGATAEPGESKPVEEGKEVSEESEKKEGQAAGEEAVAAGYGNPVAAVASGVKSWFSWS